MTPTVTVAWSVKIGPRRSGISREEKGMQRRLPGQWRLAGLPSGRMLRLAAAIASSGGGQGRAVVSLLGVFDKGRSSRSIKSFVHGVHGCSHSRVDIRHLGSFPSHTIVPAGRANGAARPVRPAVGWLPGGSVGPTGRRDERRAVIWERAWAGSSGIVGASGLDHRPFHPWSSACLAASRPQLRRVRVGLRWQGKESSMMGLPPVPPKGRLE